MPNANLNKAKATKNDEVYLFGNREEVKDDAVVWAFAYMMENVATYSSHDTNQIIHNIWD